jgi:hypothetical protein
MSPVQRTLYAQWTIRMIDSCLSCIKLSSPRPTSVFRFTIKGKQPAADRQFGPSIADGKADAAMPRLATPPNTPAKRRFASLDTSELSFSPSRVPDGLKEKAYKTGEFDEAENRLVKRISDHYDGQMALRGFKGVLSLHQEQEKWAQIITTIQEKLHTWRSGKQIMKAAVDLGIKSKLRPSRRRGQNGADV